MQYCAQIIFQGRIGKQKHKRNKINSSTIWLFSNSGVELESMFCETTLTSWPKGYLSPWPFGFQDENFKLEWLIGLFPLRRLKGVFFLSGEKSLNESTWHLHSPPTAAFYNERLEPLRRRELIRYGHLTKLTSKVLLYLLHQNQCRIPYPTANCVFQLILLASSDLHSRNFDPRNKKPTKDKFHLEDWRRIC